MGFVPTWLRQVSPLLHMTTLTTDEVLMREFSRSGFSTTGDNVVAFASAEIVRSTHESHADIGHLTKTTIFANSRWRTAAILKIALSPYLSRKLSDFDQIW